MLNSAGVSLMLKRTALRRYLKALLWYDGVPQSAECDIGYLWTNCDGERIDVFDSETHQIFENADASYQLGLGSAAVIYTVDTVNYSLTATGVDRAEIRFYIDIVANDASGEKRQNVLDQIEERILYRIYSYADFVDASTGAAMPSFMRWLDGNQLRIEVRDESDFKGSYTLRRMGVSFSTRECVKKTGCSDQPLCFDFDELTVLDDAC